jgi:riboflavin biosynthesis pyrimidine reductase
MSAKLMVVANLVIGSDGSTSKNGSSIGLSSPADRVRFHEIRSKSDAILIGGATARREPYKKTPVPLFIVTHSLVRLQPKNQLAKQLNMDPISALAEIEKFFKEKASAQLLVEAGPKLLQFLIDHKKIEKLYLTINHSMTGENKIDKNHLLKDFKLISSERIDSDEFCVYQLAN